MNYDNELPFFRKLVTIDDTEGLPKNFNSINLLKSLRYFNQYAIIDDFLASVTEAFGISENDITIAEGFRSKELCEANKIECYRENSYVFKSIVFKIANIELEEKLVIDFFQNIVNSMEFYYDYIESIEIDVNSGYILVIILDANLNQPEETKCKIFISE
jgi:hypothetical protein